CRHRDLVVRLDRFDAEHANLRQALGHLVQTNAAAALRMAGQLAWFWYLRSHLSVGRACLEQVMTAGGDAPLAVRSFALAGLGQMSLYQGDLGVAADAFAHALALAQAAGDQAVIGYTLQGQASLALFRRDFAASVSLGMASAAHYERVGDTAHTVVGRFI